MCVIFRLHFDRCGHWETTGQLGCVFSTMALIDDRTGLPLYRSCNTEYEHHVEEWFICYRCQRVLDLSARWLYISVRRHRHVEN